MINSATFTGANTLTWRFVPRSWLSTVLLVAAGSALVAISAQFSYRFSFSTVPVTGQTLAVMLVGALYGSRLGAATMVAYLAEGASGMPVFAGGTGGVGAIATASGGYIFGFIVAAYIVGWFAERGWDRSRWIVLPMVLANAALYVPGVIWLHQQFAIVGTPISWSTAMDYGVWPFIAGDLAKIVSASLLLPAGWALADRFGLRAR
ncbi:MAG TPA: biotin transporter BioY [Dehalococcoidia bacterium]|nr:biotin transporter BioY [Dehalococcoidia bacterium]